MHQDPYDDLVERVDELTGAISGRRADDLACKRGCSACCHVQLSVVPIEAARLRQALAALPDPVRARLRQRARAQEASGPAGPEDPCALLGDDGACSVYAARPLVCRTQGHALRYPEGSLPTDAVFATAAGGELTWCPLNYIERAPRSEDVLEAESIDGVLGRACLSTGHDPLERVDLADLAREE